MLTNLDFCTERSCKVDYRDTVPGTSKVLAVILLEFISV